jgi:uncharacterized small protein (DUF1192 family)
VKDTEGNRETANQRALDRAFENARSWFRRVTAEVSLGFGNGTGIVDLALCGMSTSDKRSGADILALVFHRVGNESGPKCVGQLLIHALLTGKLPLTEDMRIVGKGDSRRLQFLQPDGEWMDAQVRDHTACKAVDLRVAHLDALPCDPRWEHEVKCYHEARLFSLRLAEMRQRNRPLESDKSMRRAYDLFGSDYCDARIAQVGAEIEAEKAEIEKQKASRRRKVAK